jgi:putative PIN family toxin of toxin-antitoxin system
VKVVLDTNVWISSLLLPHSISGKIITAWQHAQFKIVTSDPILEEIREVLTYPKINKRLNNMSTVLIDEYIVFLRFFTEVIQLEQNHLNPAIKLRDKDDSCILLTFFESHSDYLITGDKDLLLLNSDYPIITPSEFGKFLD